MCALADALCPGRFMSRRRGAPLTGAEEFEFYEETGSGEGADESQSACGWLHGHVLEAVRPNGVYAFSILRRVRIYGNRRFDADDVVDGPALGFEHSDEGVKDAWVWATASPGCRTLPSRSASIWPVRRSSSLKPETLRPQLNTWLRSGASDRGSGFLTAIVVLLVLLGLFSRGPAWVGSQAGRSPLRGAGSRGTDGWNCGVIWYLGGQVTP